MRSVRRTYPVIASTARGAFCAVALAILLVACGDSTAPGNGPQFVVIGYPEIGYRLTAGVVKGGDTTVVAQSALRFSPQAGVTLATTGTGFTFTLIGTFTVSALLDSGTVSTLVVVKPPPKIVFDMVANGNRDIYRATIYGNELDRLSSNAAVDIHPSIAGNMLVYSSYRDGNGKLYARSLLGTAPETRLSTTVTANETDAVLAPDGNHIAYVRDDGGVPRVWVSDADGGQAVALTKAPPPTIEGTPGWRFASDSLVFMSTSLGNASIFRSGRLSNSPLVSAAAPKTADSVYVEPSWSPDATLIAYSAARTGGAARIAVLTRASGAAAFVTPPTMSAGQPMFLADNRIVFTIFAAGGSTSLAWVDPKAPAVIYPIPLTGTDPQHPAIIWP